MESIFIYLTFLVQCALFVFVLCKSSSNEIRAFVDGHNSRRLQVAKGDIQRQPSASEMKIMMWDPELYEKASAYAATFPRKHNPVKSVPSGRFRTGENLYWYSTTDRNYTLNPSLALESWFSEHQNYTHGPYRKSSKSYPVGHYTQMVWSDSIFVGCAISKSYKRKFKKFFVVCNYGPAGNYVGQVPYKKGGPSNSLTCGCPKNDSKCNCKKLYG